MDAFPFRMDDNLQIALDNLVSTRSSIASKGRSLNDLEKLLAEVCTQVDAVATEGLRTFIELQDTFECNVPSRLLAWMSVTAARLDLLTSKGIPDCDREEEAATLSAQLIQALHVIQGVTLIHKASKSFLGRRYALEVLLDLLMTSRHVSAVPLEPLINSVSPPISPKSNECKSQRCDTPLASTVLDTLLCILVDSSPALRVLENVNGVQIVVKILKRAGTPREVRMKCLEFLYFYLLDETIPSVEHVLADTSANTSPIPAAQTTPVPKRHTRHSHRYSASTDSSYSSASSTLSKSTSSNSSVSSDDCVSSPLQLPAEPTPIFQGLLPSPRIITSSQPRSLLMLRKEVDFVPLSPKKAQILQLGVGTPRLPSKHGHASSFSIRESGQGSFSRFAKDAHDDDGVRTPRRPTRTPGTTPTPSRNRLSVLQGRMTPSPEKDNKDKEKCGGHRRAQSAIDMRPSCAASLLQATSTGTWSGNDARARFRARTTEEKKEILGGMLGNVDTLVEGMHKAGIWGLS